MVVALGIAGVAFTSSLAALTKMNTVASISRNYTGAYTIALKQIDSIQSMSPFNPQKLNDRADCDGVVHSQIPKDYPSICASKPPTYDMTVGTHTYNNVPIYNDPPMVGGVLQLLGLGAQPTFSGTMTTTITDVSPTSNAPPHIYSATVTVTYTYRSRIYSFSMSTLRTSDT